MPEQRNPAALFRRFTIAAILVLALTSTGRAGGLRVTPIRLFLENNRPAVLNVHNDGATPMTVQLRASVWEQDDSGMDILKDGAPDLIFFPKILSVEPGGRKIVRMGFQTPPGDRESAYRLFVRELPVDDPDQLSLKMAVQISMPVFRAPKEKHPAPTIAGVKMTGGEAAVQVANRGNVTFHPNRIVIKGLDDEGTEIFSRETGGWYVLPGRSRTFMVSLEPGDCGRASVILAEAHTQYSQEIVEYQLNMLPTMCAE